MQTISLGSRLYFFIQMKFEYGSINFEELKSDRVEGIVGSSSNSSELNDSGDQAADRQQLEQETIPESSTSRYGRKRTRVLRENYVPWNNIHVETQ